MGFDDYDLPGDGTHPLMAMPRVMDHAEQYKTYQAMCEAVAVYAWNRGEYRQGIAEVQRELSQNPDFKDLVKAKFQPPAPKQLAQEAETAASSIDDLADEFRVRNL